MRGSSSSCSVATCGISHFPGVHPDSPGDLPTDGKAEAPERLRHSLKVTQHAEAEKGSAFLTDISQNVSAEILRQPFGWERKLLFMELTRRR